VTCLACAELDNKIFDLLPDPDRIGEGTMPPKEPPLHHNCRCVIVPVLQGMRDDPSQTNINYKDWFNEQDEATKLDILGPARYKEYLNGKEVTAFAKNGEITTLEKMGIDRITRKDLITENIFEGTTIGELVRVQGNLPSYFDKVSEDDWQKILKMVKDGETGKIGSVRITEKGIVDSKGELLVPSKLLMAIDDKVNGVHIDITADRILTKEELEKYIRTSKELTDEEIKEFRSYVEESMMTNFPKNKMSSDELASYSKNITNEFDNFPPQLQRLLFDTRPEIYWTKKDDTAWHDPEKNIIYLGNNYLSITKEIAASFLHELAHALDSRLSKLNGGDANTLRPSLAFYDILKSEYEKYVEKITKEGLIETIYRINRSSTNPFSGTIGASDMFRGFSVLDKKLKKQGIQYGGSFGHDVDYYTKYLMPIEGFGNLVYEYVDNKRMREFFPDYFEAVELWLKTGKLP